MLFILKSLLHYKLKGTKEEDVIQPHISEAEYTTSAQSVVIDVDDNYVPMKSLRQKTMDMRAEVVHQYKTIPYNDRYVIY